MWRGLVTVPIAVVLLLAGASVRADDKGSANDARAMLDRAVAAMKADETKALAGDLDLARRRMKEMTE